MVLSFNKRELLEFANWTINQSLSPTTKKYMALRIGDLDSKQLKKVYHFLEDESFKTEQGNLIEYYNEKVSVFSPDKVIKINFNNNIFSVDTIFGCEPDDYGYCTFEEFKTASVAFGVDFFDKISLDSWLRNEKGIELKSLTLQSNY